MTPETLEALKGSIEKWRKIVEEGGEDLGVKNCPLCHLHYAYGNCTGCPVNQASGGQQCGNTPYDEWDELDLFGSGVADTPAKIEAARAELEFLRSLLPQEEAS
jgi:hypothetical protein